VSFAQLRCQQTCVHRLGGHFRPQSRSATKTEGLHGYLLTHALAQNTNGPSANPCAEAIQKYFHFKQSDRVVGTHLACQ
jgi:hypothetical protein